MKMAESSQKVQKTLWEMEKLLVMSNFSFSHSVFKKPLVQTCKNQGLFGKGLIDFEKNDRITTCPNLLLTEQNDKILSLNREYL